MIGNLKDLPIVIELVLIGFQVLVWVTLIGLAIFDFNWIHLDGLKQWSAELSVGLIGVAYMFGLIFDKAVCSFLFWCFRSYSLDSCYLRENVPPRLSALICIMRSKRSIRTNQTEEGIATRNDRLIAVAAGSRNHSHIRFLGDLNKNLVHEIERFFISYNETKGKKFEILGRFGPDRAEALIESCRKPFRTHDLRSSTEKRRKL